MGSQSRRRAGVLCHITSLPGTGHAGTLGTAAIGFLDFMTQAGLSVWQMLPLNPPDTHHSPYHSASLFAIHTGLLDRSVNATHHAGLQSYAPARSDAVDQFTWEQSHWLDDFCRYCVGSRLHGSDWSQWPEALRVRDDRALERFDREHRAELDQLRFGQFAVDRDFAALRRAAGSRGIELFGDMPLYPAFDSADVWAHQDLFLLDEAQQPRYVAGVPPDYFSETGQLWGNPVYDWDRMVQTGFAWWLDRLAAQFRLFDMVRIDHFRGLEAFWAVPPNATSAISGTWRSAPGDALLAAFAKRFGPLAVVAEDLGIITPQVNALREAFALPGMRVAQFAFSGDPDNPHRPNNYVANTVAYTGTHDNDTTLGWYRSLDAQTRLEVDQLAGTREPMPWAMIDVVLNSIANLAIAPLQDFLGLDGRYRMNTPGKAQGNWGWRCGFGELTPQLAQRIRASVIASDRV